MDSFSGKHNQTWRGGTIYALVYRTGGTDNFTWHRSLPMSRDEVEKAKAANERMGYRCMIVNYNLSLSIGLPETYEA